MSADADPTERWIEPVTGEFFVSLCDACLVSGQTNDSMHGWLDAAAPVEKRLAIEEEWPAERTVGVRALFSFTGVDYIRRLQRELAAGGLPDLRLIVVHMGDETIPGSELDRLLADCPHLHIWGSNFTDLGTSGRVRVLPLAEQNRQWREGGTMTYDPPVLVSRSLDRPNGIFAAWRWDTNPVRIEWFEACKELLVSGQRSDIALFRYLERDEYDATLKASRAVLCPPGNGYDTHRVWEALERGAWPIVQNNAHTRNLIEHYPDLQLLVIESPADLPSLEIPERLPPFPGLLTREWWREEVRRTVEDMDLLPAAAADV